ncbi:unnamed protein product [Meloidogyne enterolobii]|uniref:Uncharacterized protein n=1 Tax=Meloidogyne enterolobii TaxID=390850 RepID=A0ACB1AGK3_MELEN
MGWGLGSLMINLDVYFKTTCLYKESRSIHYHTQSRRDKKMYDTILRGKSVFSSWKFAIILLKPQWMYSGFCIFRNISTHWDGLVAFLLGKEI